jgi:hypothetical protein
MDTSYISCELTKQFLLVKNMTLEEAVQNFNDLKAAYDQEEAEYLSLVYTRLPAEEGNLSTAELAVKNAKSALKKAETTEDVKIKRDDVAQAEETVADITQLINNLRSKVKQWEITSNKRLIEVKRANHCVWEIKFGELMEQLVLPSEVSVLLEDAIAAYDALKGGFGCHRYGFPIDEKLPEMTRDVVDQRRSSLEDAMGLST